MPHGRIHDTKLNFVDHFTVSDDLYEKQGAGWRVDVSFIEGRGKSARELPAVDPPKVHLAGTV